MDILMPADSFIVINKTILRNSDRQTITLLYQPIIGSVATSLYFTLWAFLDRCEVISKESSHHYLMATMHIDLTNIEIARKKLEGIGLIKTFHKNGENGDYIYEMFSPVSPFEFFSNPILNTGLYNNVGKIEYDRISSYYKTPSFDLKDYKDVTSKFNEVFDVVSDLPIEILSDDIKNFNYRKLQISSNIDLEDVLKTIPKEILNHKMITKAVKEYIYKLSFIYDVDNSSLASLIESSVDSSKKINLEVLKENCEKMFKFENHGKLPNLAYKEQPEYLRKKANSLSDREKMIYYFETTSPSDFLKLKNKTERLTKIEKDILSMLLMDIKLNPGVVNVLIDYVLRISDNKLSKNFIEAIALQWSRSKIETVESAMELAMKESQKRKTTKLPRVGNKYVEKEPDWLDTDIKAKEDPDAINKLNELLKGYE